MAHRWIRSSHSFGFRVFKDTPWRLEWLNIRGPNPFWTYLQQSRNGLDACPIPFLRHVHTPWSFYYNTTSTFEVCKRRTDSTGFSVSIFLCGIIFTRFQIKYLQLRSRLERSHVLTCPRQLRDLARQGRLAPVCSTKRVCPVCRCRICIDHSKFPWYEVHSHVNEWFLERP